jgi:branched-chain amino acid transport system ATP-binding protein
MILELRDITVFYGPVRGVSGISLDVAEGEIVALLGANGAGKSTVLKAISGTVKPRAGTVRFAGEDLRHKRPHQRVGAGLVQVPEGRHIFPSMTVFENLELGHYVHGGGARVRRQRSEEVLELFPNLRPRLGELAGKMSGGEQQALAIARAMMTKPRLLMVDEPSLGLDPQKIDTVYDLLGDIARTGTTVLLVEQNVALALEIASRAYVLAQGRIVLSGDASSLASDERVAEAYLGSVPTALKTS